MKAHFSLWLAEGVQVSDAFFKHNLSYSGNRSLQEEILKSELLQTPPLIGKENSNDEIS
jgi:hypothetical protein